MHQKHPPIARLPRAIGKAFRHSAKARAGTWLIKPAFLLAMYLARTIGVLGSAQTAFREVRTSVMEGGRRRRVRVDCVQAAVLPRPYVQFPARTGFAAQKG